MDYYQDMLRKNLITITRLSRCKPITELIAHTKPLLLAAKLPPGFNLNELPYISFLPDYTDLKISNN